jgi:hypothetical protein
MESIGDIDTITANVSPIKSADTLLADIIDPGQRTPNAIIHNKW